MTYHRLIRSLCGLGMALLGLIGLKPAAQAQNEQFIPALVYRTGPYAPNGIPFADGYADQTVADHAALEQAVAEGRIEAVRNR